MPDYSWFLANGWPVNETDVAIARRWRAAGNAGSIPLEKLNHIRWRLLYEDDRFPTLEAATAEWFPIVVPPVTPPDVPVTLPPRLEARFDSPFFHRADTGAVVDYREATCMSVYRLFLDGRLDEVESLFGYFQERGINSIRPLFNLHSDYWTSQGLGNTHLEGDIFWGGLHPFCHLAGKFGLWVRLCPFGGVEAFVGHQLDWSTRPDVLTGNVGAVESMHLYLDQFIGTVRDIDNVLLDLFNEPSQIGAGDDSSVVIALGDHVRQMAPDLIMSLGAACDEDSAFYAQSPAHLFDEHYRRIEDDDYLMSIKRLISGAAVDQQLMPGISGEWMNLGDTQKANGELADGSPSTALAFATSAMCRLKRIYPCFHAHSLLYGATIPNRITTDALQAWSDGCDAVPLEVAGSGCNGHWSCSPFTSDIFPVSDDSTPAHYGPVRIWGRDSLQGYIGLSIREPAGYTLVGEEREIETVQLHQWGDWQCRVVQTVGYER